jgi:hypothetical protein
MSPATPSAAAVPAAISSTRRQPSGFISPTAGDTSQRKIDYQQHNKENEECETLNANDRRPNFAQPIQSNSVLDMAVDTFRTTTLPIRIGRSV